MTSGISVALACYDGERYLPEQVASIAAQTLPPDEVVISDGGSTDGTVALARRLASEHPRLGIRVVADGQRLGVTANFARAIAASTGEFIALCDQDDVWHPDRLRAARAAFDEPTLLVHTDARLVDAGGLPLGVTLFSALGIGSGELERLASGDAFAVLIRRNLVTGATTMVRRRLVDAALPFPPGWVHDEWLALIAAAIGRLRPLPQQLIDYRQHGSNVIGVTAPTLRYRVRRMLEPRGDRYRRLAARSVELSARLDELDAPERWRALARRKAAFERDRASYPVHRAGRIPAILRGLRAGSYAELSSQGDVDVLRDLLQPK